MTTLQVDLGASAYPTALARIKGPPLRLYVRGDLAALAGPAVAVVGTREASAPGRKAAFAIGERLAAMGLTVVSGLAVGVDCEAHGGCLAAGGRTVGVLAHGLDRVYPKEHEQLAKDIVSGHGALVTEYAEGTRPSKPTLVWRNRVTTGLCLATVLVESAAQSGSMHSVRFAHEQGRPIFAVNSSAPGFQREGARRAVSEFGARSVLSLSELANAIGSVVEAWRKQGAER